jgi:hypothetical protein
VAGIVGLVATAAAAAAAVLREAAEESIHGQQRPAAFEAPMRIAPEFAQRPGNSSNGSGIPAGIAYEPGVRSVL